MKLVCNVNIVYGHLKSENSQDYAQKPQRNCNCTFISSASGLIFMMWKKIYHPLYCIVEKHGQLAIHMHFYSASGMLYSLPNPKYQTRKERKKCGNDHGVASWPNIRPHNSRGADFQSVWSWKSSAELKENFFKDRKCAEFCKDT